MRPKQFAIGVLAYWMPAFLERVRGISRSEATVNLARCGVTGSSAHLSAAGWALLRQEFQARRFMAIAIAHGSLPRRSLVGPDHHIGRLSTTGPTWSPTQTIIVPITGPINGRHYQSGHCERARDRDCIERIRIHLHEAMRCRRCGRALSDFLKKKEEYRGPIKITKRFAVRCWWAASCGLGGGGLRLHRDPSHSRPRRRWRFRRARARLISANCSETIYRAPAIPRCPR